MLGSPRVPLDRVVARSPINPGRPAASPFPSPSLSFQLLRSGEDVQLDTPRPSCRASTREVHPKDLIRPRGRKGCEVKRVGRRTEEDGRAEQGGGEGPGVGTPSSTVRKGTLAERLARRTPRYEKNFATPNDFFLCPSTAAGALSSTPSRRTLITFLSEITCQCRARPPMLTVADWLRPVTRGVANEIPSPGMRAFSVLYSSAVPSHSRLVRSE